MKKWVGILIVYLTCYQYVFAAPFPQIKSEGAILIEPKTNTVLYGKNEELKFYPASITKILTALIVLEDMNPMTVLTKTADAVRTVPRDSSHIGLVIGDSFSTKDGVYGLMLGSDNFIAHDLAIKDVGSINAFAKKMNQKAQEFGAVNTQFTNPHGYHDIYHYTTPYDMAQIARGVFCNEEVTKIAGTRNYLLTIANKNESIPLKNSSRLLDPSSPYYNEHVIASKTGWHSDAGQTLVAKAKYNQIELIAVTMKTRTPSQYEDINALLQYGSEHFSMKEEQGKYVLQNNTYSNWGKPFIAFARERNWTLQRGKNYQEPITYEEFIEIFSNMFKEDKIKQIAKVSENLNEKDKLRRKDAAYLLSELLSQLEVKATYYHANPYLPDINQLDKAYQDAIRYTTSTQLLGNKDLPFKPEAYLTYEETVCVAYRIISTCGGLIQ